MKLGRFELKPVKNTVWDYVVPMSLVVLSFMSFNYTNRYGLSLSTSKFLPSLPIEFFTQALNILVFILLIIFLPRFYRIGTWFFGLSLLILFSIVFRFISSDLISSLIFFFIVSSLSFSVGNLILVILIGNNATNKITRKSGVFLTALSFSAYGFYIDFFMTFIYFFPYPGQKQVFLEDLGFWRFPYFYFIIFFIIGLAVGIYRKWRARL